MLITLTLNWFSLTGLLIWRELEQCNYLGSIVKATLK